MDKQLNHYVSELDQFLEEYDQQHPPTSKTHQAEIQKHQPLFAKRDGTPIHAHESDQLLWEALAE